MGMPISVEIVGNNHSRQIKAVFDYFREVDNRFSTYKKDSEISKINRGLESSSWSKEMRSVFKLCEQTKKLTGGYFDILHDGKLDPSGLVKGWSIYNAAQLLRNNKVSNFYIEAGGDIQADGLNENNEPWTVGIRNPFNPEEIVKTFAIRTEGAATSGTYVRGQHIYNPIDPFRPLKNVRSLTVIGPNIYEADRFATAAFAMGEKGINFIQSLDGFEAYMITEDKNATFTAGFERYVVNA